MSEETKASEEKVASIADVTEAAEKEVRDASKQISDVTGKNTKIISASAVGKEYEVYPCSLSDVPKVSAIVTKVQAIIAEAGKNGQTNEMEVICDVKSGLLDEIAKLILLLMYKTHPEYTIEKAKEEFSLADYPIVYQTALDLNDFLSNMGRMSSLV